MRYSVLVGRASTIDPGRVFECVEALAAQQADFDFEIIVADRLDDEPSRRLRAAYPGIRWLNARPGASLPEMRLQCLEAATGEFVAVTEDHCIAPADWLATFDRAFAEAPADTVAIGGSVVNAVHETAFDQANFLCEYAAWLAPLARGRATDLPGVNVAYRREALKNLGKAVLRNGFWETGAHPALRSAGGGFWLDDRIRVHHAKRFSVSGFLRQRRLYSRYYAARRRAGLSRAQRWLGLLAPLLAPLLLGRMLMTLRGRGTTGGRRWACVPWFAVFATVMTLGEIQGHFAGDRGALAEIE